MAKIGRFFPNSEYKRRRNKVRQVMEKQGYDAILVACPENIYYLCGLDHMGYFATTLLIVPLDGQSILITRAMERATVQDQVPEVKHIGYSDASLPEEESLSQSPLPTESVSPEEEIGGSDPWMQPAGMPVRAPGVRKPDPYASAAVRETLQCLKDEGLAQARLGLEMSGTFLPYATANAIVEGLDGATWENCSGLVDDCRIVQSARELALTRKAATLSESMMLSAIAAAGEHVNQRDIMAAIYDAMFRRGGTYPGFVPLVRSTGYLMHEHGTWDDALLTHGDLLFLEMAGCMRRYHAPMGRLVHINEAPQQDKDALKVCLDALMAAKETIKPGVIAGDVYRAWHRVLEDAGIDEYKRHHCGYAVGIGYPPSWSGGGVPVGLHADSKMILRTGMVFHLMSWLLRCPIGDAFLSDTIVVSKTGCEFLTNLKREIYVR